MKKILSAVVVAISASGCAQHYAYTTESVLGVNVPDRLTGGWTYSIDDSIHDARRSAFKPNGTPCSLHTYSLDSTDALEGAIRKAMSEFLDGGTEQKSATPTSKHIVFRLEGFQPRFQCALGTVEGACTGTVEISLGVTVVKDGQRRSFTATAERTAESPGGSLCSTAIRAPAEAARKAAKDVVERAMERIYTIAKAS